MSIDIKGLQERIKELKDHSSYDIDITIDNHRCDCCEEVKDVTLCPNPYSAEIHEEENWEFLCENCYQSALEDV